MPNTDRVTIRHPELDDTVTVPRRAFPSHARRGWVEVTVLSPESPGSPVEAPKSLEDEPDNASQED